MTEYIDKPPVLKESGLIMPDIGKEIAELRPELANRDPEDVEGIPGLSKRANAHRPTKMTPEIRNKLEDAAALDASLEEMAYYAGIHRMTLYRWLKDDKELSDRVQELREKPVLRARQTINKALDDPNYSFRYLERKRAKEFMPAAKIEHTGSVAFSPTNITTEQEAIKEEYEERLRATLSQPKSLNNQSDDTKRPADHGRNEPTDTKPDQPKE